MASYESLIKEILPYVPGCPDSVVESNLRAATIEFCEKTKAFVQDLDPITTISGIYEYDLEPPADTAVHKIMWALYNGDALEPISTTLLEERKPKWREASYYGTPQYFVKQSRTLFYLVPVPNETTANSTRLRVQLKPLHKPLYDVSFESIEKITQMAFSQRRKMIKTSLKTVNGRIILKELNISPNLRPENLSIIDFCKIAKKSYKK